MKLDPQTIKKIAKLARIRIEDSEVDGYVKELSSILSLAEDLSKINTDGVTAIAGIGNSHLPWREDKVTDGNIRDAALSNAPASEYDCFVVPKVIE